ncbi:MAG TPA: hypothetical protein VFC42_17025 [Methylomirabilota bacterium]|jgi:hypothetical protein|nr:hypothetical protein [Methylomirabilota bacterium]
MDSEPIGVIRINDTQFELIAAGQIGAVIDPVLDGQEAAVRVANSLLELLDVHEAQVGDYFILFRPLDDDAAEVIGPEDEPAA